MRHFSRALSNCGELWSVLHGKRNVHGAAGEGGIRNLGVAVRVHASDRLQVVGLVCWGDLIVWNAEALRQQISARRFSILHRGEFAGAPEAPTSIVIVFPFWVGFWYPGRPTGISYRRRICRAGHHSRSGRS